VASMQPYDTTACLGRSNTSACAFGLSNCPIFGAKLPLKDTFLI